jgi:hypothetical protein
MPPSQVPAWLISLHVPLGQQASHMCNRHEASSSISSQQQGSGCSTRDRDLFPEHSDNECPCTHACPSNSVSASALLADTRTISHTAPTAFSVTKTCNNQAYDQARHTKKARPAEPCSLQTATADSNPSALITSCSVPAARSAPCRGAPALLALVACGCASSTVQQTVPTPDSENVLKPLFCAGS